MPHGGTTDVALPETRYAKSGDTRIAYQVIGNGPLDLVFVPGFISKQWAATASIRIICRHSKRAWTMFVQ
jgi:hypothetical protein